MAVAEGFRGLSRIGLDEAAIRVRQIHAKIMEANLLPADVPVRLAKIRLRMAWTMAQWNKHLPCPQSRRCHMLAHDRVATGKPLFIPQPIENPIRGVPLFLVNLAVISLEGGNRDALCWSRKLRPRERTWKNTRRIERLSANG
jgi:hypothetical protein